MPIYVWQCKDCGHEQEVIQKLLDPVPVCPTCRTPMEKKLTVAGFRLKGDGWYVTDFKGKSSDV